MKGLLMAHNGTPLLMLIDDEPAQRRLIAALAARAGWRTIFANDGETAIAMLGTQDGMRPDAILRDHWIPDFGTRSEGRRVGKRCVGTCEVRWWPYHKQ